MDFNIVKLGEIVAGIRKVGPLLVRLRMSGGALTKFKSMLTLEAQVYVLHDWSKNTVFGVRIDYDHALSDAGYAMDFTDGSAKWIPFE